MKNFETLLKLVSKNDFEQLLSRVEDDDNRSEIELTLKTVTDKTKLNFAMSSELVASFNRNSKYTIKFDCDCDFSKSSTSKVHYTRVIDKSSNKSILQIYAKQRTAQFEIETSKSALNLSKLAENESEFTLNKKYNIMSNYEDVVNDIKTLLAIYESVNH